MTRRRTAVVAVAAVLALAAGCGGGSSKGDRSAGIDPAGAPSSTDAPSSTAAPSSPPDPNREYTTPPATVPAFPVALSTAPPPWPPPAVVDQGKASASYVEAAGLPYRAEMLKIHYHAHLDVTVDGKAVTVPPYLGFVAKGNNVVGLAPLHTHDSSGIIHIENNVPATFLLGQVFVEWGVKFSATCLGGNCTGNGKELAVFVDGQRYAGDPTRLALAKHQEIAVEFGPAGALPKPPASYHFPAGV